MQVLFDDLHKNFLKKRFGMGRIQHFFTDFAQKDENTEPESQAPYSFLT